MKIYTNQLVPLLKVVSEKVESRINSKLKKYDVTFTQMRLLLLLYSSSKENYTMKEIEKCFDVTQQTAAGIANRLKEKGLIHNCADRKDKRIRRVSLTEQGRDLAVAVMDEMQKTESWLEQSVPAEELPVLLKLLQKIYDYLDE